VFHRGRRPHRWRQIPAQANWLAVQALANDASLISGRPAYLDRHGNLVLRVRLIGGTQVV
jgi:hypothetical protein